jgi:hypothetical protein
MFLPLVQAAMAADLKKAYKAVIWVGELPELPKNTSVFFYLNHQHYFDGHLVWLLGWRIFKRKFWVWMEEWDNFPMLRVLGALPFPKDDLRKRVKVVQFTQNELQKENSDVHLHSPQEDLAPFPPRIFERMDALTHQKVWLPIAARAVVTQDAYPTLFVSCGDFHRQIDGTERERLCAVLAKINDTTQPQTVVFQGTPNPDSKWNFKFLKRFFDI